MLLSTWVQCSLNWLTSFGSLRLQQWCPGHFVVSDNEEENPVWPFCAPGTAAWPWHVPSLNGAWAWNNNFLHGKTCSITCSEMCTRMGSFQSLVRKDLLAETWILHVCLHRDCSFFLTPFLQLFGEVLSTFKGCAGRFQQKDGNFVRNYFSLSFLLLGLIEHWIQECLPHHCLHFQGFSW